MKIDRNLINYVDLEQGTKEWLEFRKGKIGCSLAPSIMGKGFKTPLQLFEDIMEDKETKVNHAMERGTRLEPEAREFLNNKYDVDLQPCIVVHQEFDWHYSSTDGIYENEDGSVFVCEIKCPGFTDHQCALDGNVPEKYLPQLYHILEDLPNVDKILYFSYHPDSQAEIWVYRNEIAMKNQLNAEKEFYDRLINCKPPEPTEKDWIELSYPECSSLAYEYKEIQNEIEMLEMKARNIKEDLILELGTLSRAKIGSMKIQKVIRAGSVDYSKIEVLKGIDLGIYRKSPIVSWRLSI